MAKLSTQDAERFYFEQFRRVYTLPDGKIDYGDKPDIILNTGLKTIGIEVTRLYLTAGGQLASEQRQKPFREKVVRSAQEIYRATGGSIELSFNFNPAAPITPDRLNTLPAELANIAKRMDANALGKSGQIYPLQVIPEIANIYFTGEHYSDPHWRIFQVSSLTEMSFAALEAIVREKEVKSKQYKKCNSYWLLVIVDWTDRGQNQEIRVEGLNISSKVFKKIIIYKWGYNHIVEIKA
jgi:hypothetical protein